MKNAHLPSIFLAAALLFFGVQTVDAQTTVGGVTPSVRPANAPKITQVDHDSAWYARALTGISQPYPPSLKFLDNQGNWYTPFSRRGMPSYYDIRNLHGPR